MAIVPNLPSESTSTGVEVKMLIDAPGLRLLRHRHTEFTQLLFRVFVVRLQPQRFDKMRYRFLSMTHASQQRA